MASTQDSAERRAKAKAAAAASLGIQLPQAKLGSDEDSVHLWQAIAACAGRLAAPAKPKGAPAKPGTPAK